MQCIATLHASSVGSAIPSMHRHTATGQWAMQLLQHMASLPGGNRQCNSCNALPHRRGAVCGGTPAMRGPTRWGNGESCPGGGRCLRSGTPKVYCHMSYGQWAPQLPLSTLPPGSGQCSSYNALPHCLRAVGSGIPATHYHTTLGQWAVQLVQCSATLFGDIGQWNSCNVQAPLKGGREVLPRRWLLPKERNSCNAWPGCLGAAGSATPNNALPHRLSVVGSATLAMHCLTA